MATLKDVSNLAGVSPATVSRVLNGSAPVKEEQRKKVLTAMKQLNYTPNVVARSLRTSKTKLIGIISEGNKNHMFSQLINFISDYCLQMDYYLIVANHYNDPQREARIFNSLQQRGVDGMILSLVSKQSSIIPDIMNSPIPVTVFDRYLLFEQFSMGAKNYSVVLDNYAAGEMAAGHFLKLGHRNIAMVTGPKSVDIVRMRTDGFQDRLYKDGIVVSALSACDDFSYESGLKAAEELLRRGPLPTAVWAQSDMLAWGLINGLTGHGVKVPEDVSIMGVDNIDLTEFMSPRLTTIAQPLDKMSVAAVDLLLGKASYEKNRAVFEPGIVERGSTAAPERALKQTIKA